VEGPSLLGGGGPDALPDGPGAEESGVVERRVPGPRLVGWPHRLGVVEAIAVAHDDDPLHLVPVKEAAAGRGGWDRGPSEDTHARQQHRKEQMNSQQLLP